MHPGGSLVTAERAGLLGPRRVGLRERLRHHGRVHVRTWLPDRGELPALPRLRLGLTRRAELQQGARRIEAGVEQPLRLGRVPIQRLDRAAGKRLGFMQSIERRRRVTTDEVFDGGVRLRDPLLNVGFGNSGRGGRAPRFEPGCGLLE